MENQAQILLESRAEEAQEMPDKHPPIFVRWGSLFFAFNLSVLLAVCYFVEYPDIVEASFKLTSTNAPKPLFAKVNGKLEKLLTSEASSVKIGTILAFLESTASHEQVLRLERQLLVLQTSFTNRSTSELAAFQKHQFNNLGELQPHYQTFRNTYQQYLAFLVQGFYPRKLTLLENELTDQAQVYDNVEKQKTLYVHDLNLAQEDFAVQQKLAAQKTIAPLELKREESKLIAKKMALQQIDNTLLATAAAQNAKQKEIMELEKSVQDQHEAFAQAMNTLLSSLQQWKSNYLITSPMDGYVHFSSFLQPNQTVKVGQELFFITPAQGQNPSSLFGEIYISQHNFGKIMHGQRVLVKFNGYPYREFGQVEGKLAFISQVPVGDSVFLGKVTLPKGLITNYQKRLVYKEGMTARAEIITRPRSLFEAFVVGKF
jgi:multidrug resistance efflux pump